MPFDADKAGRAVRFFEGVLRHHKGERAGELVRLCGWQRDTLSDIFGTVDEYGIRQYQTSYVEVGKKNGKSMLAAGIALYMLVADGEPGAEVYSAASAKDQAAIVFREAAAMVARSALLSDLLKVLPSTKTIVKRDDPTCFYRAISADGDIQDGIEPHCVIADEIHRWRVAKAIELYEILERGMITRRQPLLFGITTAGVQDESPLAWRLHEYTRQCNAGILTDPHHYGRIYGADPTDDWTDERVWAKANPSLVTAGGFLPVSAIRKEFNKAVNDPLQVAAFKRFHLSMWNQKAVRAIEPEKWAKCVGGLDISGGLSNDEVIHFAQLAERKCYMGIDLSANTDLSSVALWFPRDDDFFDVLAYFWLPEGRIRERELRDKVPYSEWVRRGFIETSPGQAIDYRQIRARIDRLRELFDVQLIGYDPYNAHQFVVELVDAGYECAPVRQNHSTLSDPSKHLLSTVENCTIRHYGNPVLAWNADCVTAKSDNDLIKFLKPNRATDNKRIDGIAAAVNAIYVWQRTENEPPSPWLHAETAVM